MERVLDINDRNLRYVVTGLGAKTNGVTMESGFDITPASEIMAILCLSKDEHDLRRRIENILLGTTIEGKPFRVKDMGVAGAICVLLKDALHPIWCKPRKTHRLSCTEGLLPTSHTDATPYWPPNWL